MTTTSPDRTEPVPGPAESQDVFDLDITALESGDTAVSLINLTDDGCGSTCSSPCATAVC